ncbi:MAG: 16S rRNA (adenine(1518)-N(6)/adenine(1519)-N(6))-dimethyltransferase RsmA [Desulfuromonadales bacterium]
MDQQPPPHRARKRFGQNFLQDRTVIDRIIAAARLTPDTRVVEIGPGLGALTEPLMEAAGHVDIFELDRDLASRWREQQSGRLSVHEGDVLKLDWASVLTDPPYTLVSNLPYNISSQVLFRTLENRQLFQRLVLMFQKEVGDRICAGPGSRTYGILSVLCQVWFDIRRVTIVRPGAFVPPPKVDSVVLAFESLERPRVDIGDWSHFVRVVKAAFARRRKALRGGLTAGGWSREQIEEALEAAGIDSGRRAETLALDEFARLAEGLHPERLKAKQDK